MTGISTLRSRRFPDSLSSRPMMITRHACPKRERSGSAHPRWRIGPAARLVMTRDRLDRVDYLLIGHFVGGAGEAGVAPVHEEDAVALGVAAQGADQLS